MIDWSKTSLRIGELGVTGEGANAKLWCDIVIKTPESTFELLEETSFAQEINEILASDESRGDIIIHDIFSYKGFPLVLIEREVANLTPSTQNLTGSQVRS
jgi:hypothetical protein